MAKQTLDYLLDKVLGGAATHMPDMFEERKKQVLAPIYFEAGAALYDCRSFEYGIAYLLTRRPSSEAAPRP